jgi:hypothetical protein
MCSRYFTILLFTSKSDSVLVEPKVDKMIYFIVDVLMIMEQEEYNQLLNQQN